MGRLGGVGKFVAVMAVLALPLATLRPALAQDAPGGRTLEGKILAEGEQGIEGARVKVRNLQSGEEFTSAPTGPNGSYKLTDLPAGNYEISVQTERGIYLGNRTIDLMSKTNQTYSFSLKNVPPEQALEQARRAREEAGVKEDDERFKPPATARPPTGVAAEAAKMSFWSNPRAAVLAGLAIVVGAAIIIDELRDDDGDGSPSGP